MFRAWLQSTLCAVDRRRVAALAPSSRSRSPLTLDGHSACSRWSDDGRRDSAPDAWLVAVRRPDPPRQWARRGLSLSRHRYRDSLSALRGARGVSDSITATRLGMVHPHRYRSSLRDALAALERIVGPHHKCRERRANVGSGVARTVAPGQAAATR